MDPNGILLVDKPAGMTSHDVVNAVRKMFNIQKAGHGGTLDPSATGLLILLIGGGTKFSGKVMCGDKVYEGVMKLGVETDTQDADGEIVAQRGYEGITEEALREAVASLKGDQYQVPPMVSALKKDGIPLYKLARKGEVVEREPRFIHIHDFRITEFGLPESRIFVKCSKGVYVRTLCHDVGAKLGCGGILQSLRRTQSGKFSVENATPFAVLKETLRADFTKLLLPLSVVS